MKRAVSYLPKRDVYLMRPREWSAVFDEPWLQFMRLNRDMVWDTRIFAADHLGEWLKERRAQRA